jgi:hypothetical protein
MSFDSLVTVTSNIGASTTCQTRAPTSVKELFDVIVNPRQLKVELEQIRQNLVDCNAPDRLLAQVDSSLAHAAILVNTWNPKECSMTKGEGSVRELRDYCRDKLQSTPHKALVSLVQVANGRQLKEIKELIPHIALAGSLRYLKPGEEKRVEAFCNRLASELASAQAKTSNAKKRYERRFKNQSK